MQLRHGNTPNEELDTQALKVAVAGRMMLKRVMGSLAKKKLTKAVAATGSTAVQMLADYRRIATVVTARQLDERVSRDADDDDDDDAVLSCALAARADVVVSGDDDLLVLASFKGHSVRASLADAL